LHLQQWLEGFLMSEPAINAVARDCIASRIRLLNRLVTGIYDDALRPHGLRISQGNVLVVVAVRGPIRASEVCRFLKLDKSTLSRDLERLVANGWITRSPLLEITTAGREVLTASWPAWRKAQRAAKKLLTPELAEALMGRVRDIWAEDAPPDQKA
jgi:DNA-binding MarR family transcriptional regulator